MTHLHVPQSRRRLLASAARAAALIPFYGSLARGQSDPVAAATAELIAGLNEAALARRPYRLKPGVTTIYRVILPEGAHLVGAKGGSTLRLGYDGGMLANETPLEAVTFEGVTFDGAHRPMNDAFGLLNFYDVAHVEMDDCVVQHSTTGLFQHRCGGRIRLSTFRDLTGTAIDDDNCAGMLIDANRIHRCGDNGIHHWGLNSRRHDGSRISNNVITDVSNRSGGDGMFGNGVRVADCGPLTIDNNVVERCEFSAIRNSSGWSVDVSNNRCKSFNEQAMYAEFSFRDATFVNNVIEDCGAGIAACNYVGPGNGDRALISGNVITKLRSAHPGDAFSQPSGWRSGLHGEGDVRMVGNTVVGAPQVAVLAGYFGARQNVIVEGNRLIDNEYAVGFATQEGVGPCEIVGNEIRGSKKANIVAMFQWNVISGDLGLPGVANPYKNTILRDNRIV